MNIGRFLLFLVIVLGVWGIIHGYVFWRLATVPWVIAHIPRRALVVAALALWASFPLVHMLGSRTSGAWLYPLEFVAGNWIGILFLLFVCTVASDIVTMGGFAMPRFAPCVRGWALILAVVLCAIALVQGMRPPVVSRYEVRLPGLPPERDGTVMAAVSDLHLGTLIGVRWTERLVARLNGMHPDIVAVAGDLLDAGDGQAQRLLPALKRLHAPLGVWAVTGNHESYTGLDRSIKYMEDAGFTVLRDRWAQAAPGLMIAGVDDLTARRDFGLVDHPMEKALAGRPPGGTILLSHTPHSAKEAAANGAGLMISGHTHGGQIWPFNYLARMSHPMLAGRYETGGMTVIVGRGTGTWGSRMRLWLPGEILMITLRSGGG